MKRRTMLSNKLIHVSRRVFWLCCVVIASSLVSISQTHARTVVGQIWSFQCDNAACAVAEFCARAQEGINANPNYRNLVCPSNGVVIEIDRIVEYGHPTIESEPYILYKVDFEYEYEIAYGGGWRTQTFSYQVRGREVLECDCNEAHTGLPITSGAPQYCVDMEEVRYQEIVNGVFQPEIYNYLPNNHGERCPPIDTATASEDDGGGHCVGNPCNPSTGNKYQSEIDISGDFNFVRSYNSRNLFDHGLGKGWRNSYQKRLAVGGSIRLTIVSNTGKGKEKWNKVTGRWKSDTPDSDVSLVETDNGFSVTRANGDVENYHQFGRLLSETDAQGNTSTYNYDTNDRLASVTNNYGQSLTFTYDGSDHLITVTDSLGSVYSYEYDLNDNLVSVIYPDTTPTDDSDNPRRTYHYENTLYPNHLTGITDENGNRFATWSYDSNGKAISTEHAQTTNTSGQERFELNYQGSN